MLILKCTEKAATAFGWKRRDLPRITTDENQPIPVDWFVNTIRMRHTKFLLFTHAATLYSFVVRYRKKDLADPGALFRSHLRLHLSAEGISDAVIAKVLNNYEDVQAAQTDDRRVLGSMNDFAWLFKNYIAATEDIEGADLVPIAKKLNRVPQLKRGDYPIELLSQRLSLLS